LLGNVQSQFEQMPHLANMARDLLERMSQPTPTTRRHRGTGARTTGSCACSVPPHLAGGALAAGGPLNHWPAGIMVAVGLYLIVRR
jgi:ubiquinone biosynthesis protein